MKLTDGKVRVVRNNIDNLIYEVKVEGMYNGTLFTININWNPGYNTPQEVLELANKIID